MNELKPVIDFVKKNQRLLLIIMGLLALLWILKKTGVLARLFGDTFAPDVDCGFVSLKKQEQKSIATSVRNSISGWNFRKAPVKSAFQRLLELDLADLCAVANTYKNKYAGKQYPTLRTLVENEWLTDTELIRMRNDILDNLASIGH